MKNYLVSGGTGSLGSQIVKRLLKEDDTRTIRIFSRGEYLQSEARKELSDNRIRWCIGDIRDYRRVLEVMGMVDVVFHTAALKQVPACEYNPQEAVMTNCEGSINIIRAAQERGVRKVIGISSDKAVNPVSLYGATKLVMERLFIQANQWGETAFSICRMGNFIGSRGSVLPEFAKGNITGKVIITDGNASRYWIELPDAADFVFNCSNSMWGGEIFIPKMNEMTINEWVARLAPDAKKEVIGLRDGERMREPLWTEQEEKKLIEIDKGWMIK